MKMNDFDKDKNLKTFLSKINRKYLIMVLQTEHYNTCHEEKIIRGLFGFLQPLELQQLCILEFSLTG